MKDNLTLSNRVMSKDGKTLLRSNVYPSKEVQDKTAEIITALFLTEKENRESASMSLDDARFEITGVRVAGFRKGIL